MSNMVLTEEQKERIRRNRERALEIRKQRLGAQQEGSSGGGDCAGAAIAQSPTSAMTPSSTPTNSRRGESNNYSGGKRRGDPYSESPTREEEEEEQRRRESKKRKGGGEEGVAANGNPEGGEGDDDNDDTKEEELEDFEVGASEHVTKSEAMKVYCLPEGTLAVCKYEEKPNPRNKTWTPMKLYYRSEVRRYARERYGSLQGLQEERNKRQNRQFQSDLKKARDVFSSST